MTTTMEPGKSREVVAFVGNGILIGKAEYHGEDAMRITLPGAKPGYGEVIIILDFSERMLTHCRDKETRQMEEPK